MTKTTTIAIVEDDAPLRDAISNLLRSSGIKTQLYSSAINYLQSGESESDIIITDMAMPGMTGIQLQEAMISRRDPRPIIVITALVDAAVTRKAGELGAIACLLKPVDEATLMKAINAALAARPETD